MVGEEEDDGDPAGGMKLSEWWEEEEEEGAELVGGDVGGAAAVAGGLGPLDVQVEKLHLWEGIGWLGEGGARVEQTAGGLTLLPVSWDRYGFSSSPITA